MRLSAVMPFFSTKRPTKRIAGRSSGSSYLFRISNLLSPGRSVRYKSVSTPLKIVSGKRLNRTPAKKLLVVSLMNTTCAARASIGRVIATLAIFINVFNIQFL